MYIELDAMKLIHNHCYEWFRMKRNLERAHTSEKCKQFMHRDESHKRFFFVIALHRNVHESELFIFADDSFRDTTHSSKAQLTSCIGRL